jgi:methylated-DNA-[protein]-cysteine S-methyltransferase
MARRTKASPERLYGSTLSWEGWTFRVLSSRQGLRCIELSASPIDNLARRLPARILHDDVPIERALDELHRYLRGETREFSVPLYIRGTPFQQSVWEAVAAIPYGKTAAYSEIAAGLRNPQASRAVGQAVGANPLPIVIPCHRVLGKDERLVGYSGGLPLKERLLMLERGSLSL